MTEERPLFIEKKLAWLECPESPRPGTAYVFVGDGIPAISVGDKYERKMPTPGEILWRKYSTCYEVDMGERPLVFFHKLPSVDAFEFHAEVRLTYAVDNPIIIVRCARTDAGQFLQNLAIDVMRRISRRYSYKQIGEAEKYIAEEINKEVFDKGFKLTRPAFVTLSLDEAVRNLLFDGQVEKIKIANSIEANEIKQLAKLALKCARADVIAPLVESGNWQRLLVMYDPNDPEDQYLGQIIAVMSDQRRSQEAARNKLLDEALKRGAIEDFELRPFAKALLQEKSGLSDPALAYLSDKSVPIHDNDEENRPMPNTVSRKKTGN